MAAYREPLRISAQSPRVHRSLATAAAMAWGEDCGPGRPASTMTPPQGRVARVGRVA